MTEVDLFISTQRIKVLNADSQVLSCSLAVRLPVCLAICLSTCPFENLSSHMFVWLST